MRLWTTVFVALGALGAGFEAWGATATCTVKEGLNVTPFSGPAFGPPQATSYRPMLETADYALRIDVQQIVGCCAGGATIASSVAVRARGEVFRIDMNGTYLRRHPTGVWTSGTPDTFQGVVFSVDHAAGIYSFSYRALGTDPDAFRVTITRSAVTGVLVVAEVDSARQMRTTSLCQGTQDPTLALETSHFDAKYQPADLRVSIGSNTPIAVTSSRQVLYVVEVGNLGGTSVGRAPLKLTSLPTGLGDLTWTCPVQPAACSAASGAASTPPSVDLPIDSVARIEISGVANWVASPQTLAVEVPFEDDLDSCNNSKSATLVRGWSVDQDQDGYGKDDSFSLFLENDPARLSEGGDCDDANPGVHPGATEACDRVDNDCDGATDPEGTCLPDAGVDEPLDAAVRPDAAASAPDAGSPKADAGTAEPPAGCGCSAAGGVAPLTALLVFAGVVRARRRMHR
ncbi:MAG TPA: putative metal-binding motif-containing protein [Myxococcales bacterium]|jgi:MYXO-CTERM domain-containing protein